jgi:hypothetical protein
MVVLASQLVITIQDLRDLFCPAKHILGESGSCSVMSSLPVPRARDRQNGAFCDAPGLLTHGPTHREQETPKNNL